MKYIFWNNKVLVLRSRWKYIPTLSFGFDISKEYATWGYTPITCGLDVYHYLKFGRLGYLSWNFVLHNWK